MAAVRASIRVSISWKGAPAYEDTDTLVLTIHDLSLDLRVFTSGKQKGEVDWSTVAKVEQGEGSTKEHPILRWNHIIDSRPPSGVDDEGKFATLPNGDVVESGEMFNPSNGNIEAYEEVWRRLDTAPGEPYLVLELTSGGEGGTIAYLGRVGSRALGLAKKADGSYLAWRDEYKDGKASRLYTFGEGVEEILPCLPVDVPEKWKLGETLKLGGKSWTVRQAGTI